MLTWQNFSSYISAWMARKIHISFLKNNFLFFTNFVPIFIFSFNFITISLTIHRLETIYSLFWKRVTTRGYVPLQHLGKIFFFWKWIIKEHFLWWQYTTPLTSSKQEWEDASIYYLDFCTRIEPPFPKLKQHFNTQSSVPSNPNNHNMLTDQEDGQMIHVPQNHYI